MIVATTTMSFPFLSALLLLLSSCRASSYNAYNYDLTTPQFTPDGRLLQVEYASRAQSPPCLVMRLPDQHVICIMTASASRKLQQRLIQTSPDTVVCLSGIVSDCVALLRKVYEDQDENRRLYGTSGGGLQVVQTISRACQQHSFGGGIRPYGATVVVVSKERIWQTHPSGAVREVTDHIHVLGGTPSQQEELKQQLISSKRTDSTLSEVLEMGARLLSQQMSKTSKPSLPWLEAMLVSPEKGIYRLNQEQIEALIQKVGNQANQRE